MENRRQFSRIVFSSQAQLTLEQQHFTVNIFDLSLKGALVSTPDPKQHFVEQHGLLKFQLNDSDLTVTMAVKVAHQEPEVVGLTCTSIDLESISYLRRMVELNLGDAEQLNLELSQLSKL